MCQRDTIIDDGYAHTWKLDCLHCPEFNKLVACSFTTYERETYPLRKGPQGEKRGFKGEWKLCGAAIYYHIPDRADDMFILGFNVINKTTTFTRIGDADTGIKKIHTFDKIMDINLDNLISKTKLTLMFS